VALAGDALMDREQIIEFVGAVPGNFAGLPEEQEAAATAVVDALIERDLLVVGERRRWRVRVDDPTAEQAYTYDDIEAHCAWAACVKAARRAIVDDPRATVRWQDGKLPDEKQRRQLADGDLAELVARFAIAEEL
jgi:hypothetical protein